MTLKKRNLALPIGMTAIVLIIGIFVGMYYIAPSSYLSIDVNPSIEIHTNRLNQVTSVYPVNEDAQKLMSGYVLSDKSLENVIEDIVDRLILSGYLTSELDNQILISTGDKESSGKLLERADTIIATYLGEKQLDAKVLQQNIVISAQSIEEAHETNVSAGKMSVIDKIIEKDADLNKEDLADERISDLVSLAAANNVDAITSATVKQPQESTQKNDANEVNGSKSVSVTKPATNKVDAITSATVKQPKQNVQKSGTNEDQEDIENYGKEDRDYEDGNYEDNDDQEDFENDGDNEDQQDIENDDDNENDDDYENDGISDDREDNDNDEDNWEDGENDNEQEDQDEDNRGNYEEEKDHDNDYGRDDDED